MHLPTMKVWHAVAFLTISSPTYATPHADRRGHGNVCVDKVFQFSHNGTQVENLAVRSNGNVLFTLSAPSAQVWQVDPRVGNSSGTLVASTAQLSNTSSAGGITEVEPDLFAVVSCDLTLTSGTCKVHTIDFTTQARLPKVDYITTVAEGVFLNGLASLCGGGRTVLASDSFRDPQAIFKIDLKSGASTVALQDKSMEPPANSTRVPAIGINGLRKLGDYVYYTNSGTSTLWRVPIHPDGTAAAPSTLVSNLTTIQPFVDDLAIRPDGTAFVAGSNEITVVRPDGCTTILAGAVNQTMPLAGTTSAQCGRGSGAEEVLYVSTTGGAQDPVNGVYMEPGFVAAIRWGGGCQP
ncbi:hypothetical protein DOTSEDRAFT_74406 [Dothistroma septosporum NZE10]|uniref:SMP-30/Gluconolactonase/LRE-like region domain-containing protein n=1 Tax=Dothistroma septosporum (strain NZE10 / CBS 128990) TaxID=675120 RepID=N1PHP6_DOTSN|nr:hypothetical protein DOTSEDRAFT_74406 [Dothistroma septosporum NZE10]